MNKNITSLPIPARPNRSHEVGLVPFLFGVAGTEELPGVVLVRLLGDFGMGTVAARGLLARMRQQGQLASTRHGREVGYRLAGPFAATFHRLRADDGTPPPWSGHFHALLYQVPEARRAYRDRLRRIAQFVGYGIMQQGVLIAARDLAADLAGVLAECPPECRVQPATICLPAADAAQIAWTAWDLDTVQHSMRGHIDSLTAGLRTGGEPPATPAALRQLATLLNPAYIDLIRDPGLPAELLPADWPKAELTSLLHQTRQHYLPPAARYVHDIIATHSTSR